MDNLLNKAEERNQKQKELEHRITELAREQYLLMGYNRDEWLPIEIEAQIKGKG